MNLLSETIRQYLCAVRRTETYNQLSETVQGLRKPYGKEVEENGRGKDERKGVINEGLL